MLPVEESLDTPALERMLHKGYVRRLFSRNPLTYSCFLQNSEVPEDALVVNYKPDIKGGQASTGYKRKEDDPTPGRHHIEIGDIADHSLQIVAHELGHVFGMGKLQQPVAVCRK